MKKEGREGDAKKVNVKGASVRPTDLIDALSSPPSYRFVLTRLHSSTLRTPVIFLAKKKSISSRFIPSSRTLLLNFFVYRKMRNTTTALSTAGMTWTSTRCS